MLLFYNVPSGAPNVTCANASSFAEASAQIDAKWKPFLVKSSLAKPIGKTAITIGTLGNALSQLNVDGMPLDRCHQYIQLYLEGAPKPFEKMVSARPWMGGLSSDHRGCADQILACTLSWEVARVAGYKFIGQRDYVNKSLEAFGPDSWTHIWPNNGPDYLLAGNGHFAFLESKGCATGVKKTPVQFSNYKAQSLNAEIHVQHGAGNIAVTARHILSYAYLPAGGVGTSHAPASVQWFNAEQNSHDAVTPDASPGAGIVTVAVALAEFSLHCHNQGFDHRDVLSVAEQAEDTEWKGIRAVADAPTPFLLLSVSGVGPALAIANRCAKVLSAMRSLLNEAAKKGKATDSAPADILAADQAAFGLLRKLEEAAKLDEADRESLRRFGLNLRFGPPQQIFSTGLFTVSIPRRR